MNASEAVRLVVSVLPLPSRTRGAWSLEPGAWEETSLAPRSGLQLP